MTTKKTETTPAARSREFIARRLFLVAVGLLLASGCFIAVSLGYLRTEAMSTGEKLSESYAQIVEEQTTHAVQSVNQRLRLASDDMEKLASSGALNEQSGQLLLRRQLRELPFARAMWVMDSIGRIIHSSDDGNIGFLRADRDYFKIFKSQPQTAFFLGAPIRGQTSDVWTISAARPLRAADGAFAGVIVVALLPSHFERLWAKIELGAGGTVALWRRDGSLIIRSPGDQSAPGTDNSESALFREAFTKSAAGTLLANSATDGQSQLYAFRTLTTQPELVVAVGQSLELILKPWRDFALLVAAIWAAAALLIMVLSVLLFRAWRQHQRREVDAREMAQRLTLATDAGTIGIWDWNVLADQWFATPICYTVLGEQPGNGIRSGQHWLDRVYPDDRDTVMANMKGVLAGSASKCQYEARVQHSNGTVRWVRVVGRLLDQGNDGKATRILGVAIDITERKQAEVTLRTSEERFRSVWDNSVDGMRLCDAAGRVVSVNAAYCATVAMAREAIEGHALTIVYAADERDWIFKRFIDNIEAKTSDEYFEIELVLLSGSKRWFGISNTLLHAADGSLQVLSIFRDIGERKQTELALAESEQSFRTIIERSADAMCVYRDGKVIYVNPATVALAGVQSEAQLIGTHVLDMIHPDSRQRVLTRLTEVANGDAHDSLMELKFLKVDGQVVEVEARGTAIVYAGQPAIHVSMRDITDSRAAETALRKSEVALAEAQRVAGIGSWQRDTVTDTVEWSDELYRILDWDMSMSPPNHEDNFKLYTDDSAAELRLAVQELMFTGVPYKLDLERQCTDGLRRWVGVRGEVLRNSEGQIIGRRGTVQDITSRKQAEMSRDSLEAQLRESQKMEAIGTLAGGIAHDFNNILATILGNTELARQDISGNAPALESLAEIRKAGERASDLVRQILSFSRREVTQRTLTALTAVVNESASLLRATLPARLQLNVHCHGNVPPVLVDKTQIQQVIINLVTNAMQSIRSGPGMINMELASIQIDNAMAAAHPALRAMQANHNGQVVRLTVSDDGPGMDAAIMARVFEPFFTTKPVDEGTGLGLSVVHGIVSNHDGAIVVESASGSGASFAVYFPVATVEASPAPNAVRNINSTIPAAENRQHIMYIDDDEALVFLIKRLLERRGYRVHGFTDQLKALAELRAAPDQFVMVVTDYNMPGMSGLDVARAVRDIRADLTVAIASGFIDETLRTQAGGAGVRELIFKANAVEDMCDAFERLASASALQ